MSDAAPRDSRLYASALSIRRNPSNARFPRYALSLPRDAKPEVLVDAPSVLVFERDVELDDARAVNSGGVVVELREEATAAVGARVDRALLTNRSGIRISSATRPAWSERKGMR